MIDQIGIYGRKDCGKTTLLKEILAGRDRVIIYDTNGEHQCPIIVDDLARVLEAVKANWQRGFRISYRPAGKHHVAHLGELADLCRQIQEPNQKELQVIPTLTLVVEEIHFGFGSRVNPDDHPFGDLCSISAHKWIDIIGTSQRLSEVSTRFRGNCTRAYFMSQLEAVDIDAACRNLGRDRYEEIRALPRFEYLCNDGGEIRRGINKNP